jgi:hypothetical protein
LRTQTLSRGRQNRESKNLAKHRFKRFAAFPGLIEASDVGRCPKMSLQVTKPKTSRWKRNLAIGAGCLALGYLILLFPEGEGKIPRGAGREPFTWQQDQFWAELQQALAEGRTTEPRILSNRFELAAQQIETSLEQLRLARFPPEAEVFTQLETNLFRLAPVAAVAPTQVSIFINLVNRARLEVKRQSTAWDLESIPVRHRLYRLLYGTRLALEEVLLQRPEAAPPGATVFEESQASRTPVARVLGVEIQSGDILVSRAGAATSSLISRGNDFPGSYSHVAVAHVNADTGQCSIIESLSQRGVVITPLDHYLGDKKLRLLVLRLRPDLPAVVADPQLPHRAAVSALDDARQRHIPYDFSLDSTDHSQRFCSEVASAAYESAGIKLWMGMTYISSPAVIAWLASLGARHFETQEPADLEYDPQLRVVAEWRDPATLFKAHVDDAVTDVLLAEARPGEGLPYQWALLPAARILKGYSLLLNACGKIGPIPEGMSATTSLRVDLYRRRHAGIAARVLTLADEFSNRAGYKPPYWELVRLARQACGEMKPGNGPRDVLGSQHVRPSASVG